MGLQCGNGPMTQCESVWIHWILHVDKHRNGNGYSQTSMSEQFGPVVLACVRSSNMRREGYLQGLAAVNGKLQC